MKIANLLMTEAKGSTKNKLLALAANPAPTKKQLLMKMAGVPKRMPTKYYNKKGRQFFLTLKGTYVIRAANGKTYAVDTRIAREVDGELIAWRSTEESEIDTEGRVTFEDAPGDRGTRVSLIIAYKPKGGAVGDAIATLARRSPALQARHDLKRFKMLMETGEIASSARTREEQQHQLEEAR
jgi:hypothetical protein